MTQLFAASFDGLPSLPLSPPPAVRLLSTSPPTRTRHHYLTLLRLLQLSASSCSSHRQQQKHTGGSKGTAVQCRDSARFLGSHVAAEPHQVPLLPPAVIPAPDGEEKF